jgi:surface polysaccharide O-acyltransferase-like enzyme
VISIEHEINNPSHGARLAALDVFKGVAMLAVVLIHVSSHALRRLEGENAHFVMMILNRAAQFAVPAFLFLTALTATRSSLRPGFSALRFYQSKLSKVLVPYLIWSLIYGLFRVGTGGVELSDLTSLTLWRDWLLGGDAFYHLYFLVVLIQFYAIFPLVRSCAWLPTGPAVVMLLALQVGAYWLNRLVLNSPAPGSLASSYIVVLGLGMLVGARLEGWSTFWRRRRLGIVALAALSLTFYLPDAVLALEGVPVNTFAHSAASWVYSSAFALALLGVCTSFDQRSLGRNRANFKTLDGFFVKRFREKRVEPTGGLQWSESTKRSKPEGAAVGIKKCDNVFTNRPRGGALGLIGRWSFPVYLIHPSVIVAFGGFAVQSDATMLTVELIGLVAVAVLAPLSVAWMLEGSRLSRWAFGR